MRKLFAWLPKSRGKRILTIIGLICGGGFLLLVVLGVTAFLLFRSPKFQAWLWPRIMSLQAKAALPDLPPVPQGPPYHGFTPKASDARTAADLYRATNIWTVHLKFTHRQWDELGPRRVAPVSNWLGPEGPVTLRNPAASRPGVAGILGFDFPWSRAEVEFGGVRFTNAGARFKGNGTFLSALRAYKRPFKLDLNKHESQQQLAGRTALNLANLGADFSCLSDALAYELFRDAGVPAPRTAYARVFLTIDGNFKKRLLGLYALVENLDEEWAEEVFGIKGVALFKPSTYELLYDLGDDWKAYEPIYDPKTKLTQPQQRRVIELARLVGRAGDAEFGSRIGELIDLDEFARFLACEVLLAHYDGILMQGQNFFLYLEPRSNRFGIVPWDQDHSWGEFPFIATADQRERASIWHPWARSNRFLERLFAVEDFKNRYRAELERVLATLFVPERLNRRID
ncbi:MAG TPA: CotH kinase family protein [Candidatus Eisenbacteria bacterium]|nr:CotH kinase family protein [Candidatus Eisenbacteria bacterium]